ncbi:SGNH/GDSL hydrolase family protein (plasmid) [Salipiger sp. H15]|uniref:SGNH/GDSL hydrolase family protein n=1 Tax=Alloyangia sp. H15 TaxID=3029062 RepID=A0AAU8AQG5_9RHOB
MRLSNPAAVLGALLVVTGLGLAGAAAALWAGVELRPAPEVADRPFTVPMPGDAGLRLTVLGTSLSNRQLWPGEVAERLRGCAGIPVALSVVAQNGAGSDWGLAQVERVAAERPDLVLVEFAINDADVTDGMSLAASARTHAELIRALRDASPGTEIVLLTMSPAEGLRGVIRPRLRAHYLQYRALADEMGVGLIDLYPRWLALPRSERGLARDGLHPDPQTASDLIAPVIAGAVARALTGAECGDAQRGS